MTKTANRRTIASVREKVDRFDVARPLATDCRRARCGDGVMWIGVEECDANDFGGHSCQTIQGQMCRINASGLVFRIHV